MRGRGIPATVANRPHATLSLRCQFATFFRHERRALNLLAQDRHYFVKQTFAFSTKRFNTLGFTCSHFWLQ